MSRNTLNFALPESMRAYVDARVASGHYGNTSEYLRELIRKDQAEQARERLRTLIAQGIVRPRRALVTDGRGGAPRHRARRD